MTWIKEAVTDGEVDALQRAALAACNEDTRYPRWRGSSRMGRGECFNMARWLVSRLGGHIGSNRGHYVWLSPDKRYFIDLTSHHTSGWAYEENDGTYHRTRTVDNERTKRFIRRANRIFNNLDKILALRLSLDYAGDAFPAEEPQREDDRERFNDSGGPEQYWHDEPSATTPEGLYQFVYTNGQLEVSPNHSHEELAGHAGIIPAEHSGPFAAGHVVVTNGKATWEVQANVNLHSFFRILKDASKQYGWQWGGMTDAEGQPISEMFAPKSSARILHYVVLDEHLFLGRTSAADLAILADRDDGGGRTINGTLRIIGHRAEVSPVNIDALPYLFDWANDNGLRLYANNDNVIKTIPDLQEENNYDPQGDWNPTEQAPKDERLPTGLYRCPACSELFPNWGEYQKHRREQESWGDPDRNPGMGDYGLPEPDHGIYGDGAHYHEMRQEPGVGTVGKVVVLPARSWEEAARVDGFAKYAKAFNYDNDSHLFYVAYRNGDPLGYAAVKPDGGITMMHSVVENQGIAKAIYSKLIKHFDSLYTHAAHEKTASLLKHYGWVQSKGQLWRWSADKAPTDLLDAPVPFIYDVEDDNIFVGHPGARTSDIPGKFTPGGIVEGEYEPGGKVVIRSMTSIPYTVRHMIELWYYTQPQLEVKSVHLQDDAGKDTRLANVGSYVAALAAIDPAVHMATGALLHAGGEVYVVGGAVRDAAMGKEPQDIDLLVTGLPEEKIEELLVGQPGKLVHEGKSFGVFHYHHKGSEVHIALPRSERSTGFGHKEFDVKADPSMKPEDDLYRRDFTANSMAVNLKTGALLDPFGGAADIASGMLRVLSDRSFADDPLRVVRALVAASRHGLDPDETTRAQMAANAAGLRHLPPERIQAELDKLLASKDPAKGIYLAHETGVLEFILPEVENAFKFGSQNNPHHELELGDHLLNVLSRICEKTNDPDLRLAALLHDIGKPGSAWKDPEFGTNHYYAKHLDDGSILGADHEELGADLVRQRMNTLRYPNERIDRVSGLVRHHMYAHYTTTKGARRFLARVGDHADDLLTLRWADQGGKSQYPSAPAKSLDIERKLIDHVRAAKEATSQAQLAINGHDLIKNGFEPGPQMGKILSHLTERVIDKPSLNEPNTLLKLAKEYDKLRHDDEEDFDKGTAGQAEEEVQLSSVRGSVTQKFAQGDEEAQVEPEFPDSADAEAVHEQALIDHGQAPEALRNPGGLESAMGRAANYWHYGQGSPGERMADAAGALAHGMGMAQAFTDGNKRTAYHTTRGFLHANGYGHLSPLEHDDEELADHLIGHGEGTHSLEDTQTMFRSRLRPEELGQ